MKSTLGLTQALLLVMPLALISQSHAAERCAALRELIVTTVLEAELGTFGISPSRNPLLTPVFQSRNAERIFRRTSFSLLSHDTRLPPDLRAYAQAKVKSFRNTPYSPVLSNALNQLPGELKTQAAMEYIVGAYPHAELEPTFRAAALNWIATSPLSDHSTVDLLLPTARGTRLSDPRDARIATEAILKITERHGSYPPRFPASGQPRTDVYEVLKHEPIKNIRALGASQKGVNTTLIVEFENGEKGIFKPRIGDHSFARGDDAPRLIYFAREATADDLIETWFKNAESRDSGNSRVFVPPSIEASIAFEGKTYGVGSLQHFQKGFISAQDIIDKNPALWNEIWHSSQFGEIQARARTLDYLLGNNDRFPNTSHRQGRFANILLRIDGLSADNLSSARLADVKPDSMLAAMIDNGAGRPGGREFHLENAPVRAHIPLDLAEVVRGFDEQAFRNAYDGILPDDGINDTIERINAVRWRLDHGP